MLSNVIIIYFTSYYFVTTTMSRVGYGDYKAISDIEKCLCSIMMLCSFIVFGYLMDNETNKKKTPKLQEILNLCSMALRTVRGCETIEPEPSQSSKTK